MQKKLDLSLYLVLDPILCGGIAGMIETTRIAVEHGVTAVQLRAENTLTKKEWFNAAAQLKQILAPTEVPLIINDHVEIALAIDADGVHVGQNDLPADVVRSLIGKNKLLGLSVSNVQELKEAPLAFIDYLGIGPVFPTTSKKNAAPALGINELVRLVSLKKRPAVGIGGINLHNSASVLETSVDGIAVVSAICGQPDVGSATSALHQIVMEAKLW